MARSLGKAFGLTAVLAVGAVPAMAAPFKCPHVGGDFTFGQEANVNSLDENTSGTISTHDVALNIFEQLITRDEKNRVVPDIADGINASADGMTYTFPLRQGVKFHNGKTMTSADVLASLDRFTRVGLGRGSLDNVASYEAPDANTLVIHMKKPQPTFLETLSAFSFPVIIIPAESRDDPPQQLRTIGTGPWMLDQFVPGGYTRLKRFDGYVPNTHYENRDGLGGYKQACFDTVTFRMVTEPGARVAGLKTGELQGVEDLPTKSANEMKSDPNITLIPLKNWWIQIALPNVSQPPTDNLAFRKAVQAALDMDDIMDAATDNNYSLNVGFQYPYQSDYTDAGKETYNLHNAALAKKYLAESGYKGEPVVLLTDKDYPAMYNSALVMSEQMKAVGINAQLRVLDWPTSVQVAQKADTGWNFFYTGWGTPTAIGAVNVMLNLAPPVNSYMPKDGKADPDLEAAYRDMNDLASADARQAAFERMQKLALERVYAVPFGSLTKIQAVRANVKGFAPARIPRVSNVWFAQ
jgi:peptide/nickel transport system substrate-binding protein